MSRVLIFSVSVIYLALFLMFGPNNDIVAREDAITKLPANLVTLHQQYPGCVKLNDPVMPQTHFAFSARLDEQTELFGILCEPSTYNLPYAVYIVREGYYEDAERVFFADYNLQTGWTGTDLLYNADFNKKTGVLKGFSKGRGLGDCGGQVSLKWDGQLFSMMEFRYKDACDEDVTKPFPLIYKRN